MKFTRIQAIVTALLLLAACGNENSFQTDPSITEVDGNTISSFHFNAEEWGLEAADRQTLFELALVPEDTDSVITLPAEVTVRGEQAECRMTLEPAKKTISDGNYTLYLFSTSGIRAAHPLLVSLRSHLVEKASVKVNHYKPMSGTSSERIAELETKDCTSERKREILRELQLVTVGISQSVRNSIGNGIYPVFNRQLFVLRENYYSDKIGVLKEPKLMETLMV